MIDPSQRPLPDNTLQLQETGVHASGGVRTCNHCKPAAANPRLRLRGHWDRQKKSPSQRKIQHCYSLYTKIISVCCEDYSKHTKQVYRKNTIYNVEQLVSISCFQWALKSSETNNWTQLRTVFFPNLVTNPQLFIRSNNGNSIPTDFRTGVFLDFLALEDGTDRLVVPKRRYGITAVHCIISQLTADLPLNLLYYAIWQKLRSWVCLREIHGQWDSVAIFNGVGRCKADLLPSSWREVASVLQGAAEITPTFWRSIKIKWNKVHKNLFYL